MRSNGRGRASVSKLGDGPRTPREIGRFVRIFEPIAENADVPVDFTPDLLRRAGSAQGLCLGESTDAVVASKTNLR
jgi:hypothetical protein